MEITATVIVVVVTGEGGESLQQFAHRSDGCPVLGDVQGQAGPGSEQSDRAVDVPVFISEELD